MRIFAATLAALLGVVVLINGLAAWDQQRHERRLRAASASFQPGRVMLVERDMDERRFQKARIAAIPRPRVVAIGSSRVMQLSTTGLGLRPGEFYNAGIPAPTVEDYIAVWWWLKRYGKIPDVAVFSVDVWAFHRYQSQVHVAVVADEVTRFLEGAGVGRGCSGPAEEVVYWWYRAKEFFSYTVLRRSLRDLERMRIGRAPRGADVFQVFVPEAEMAGRSARRADGSMVNDGPSPNEPPADVGPAAVRFVLPGTTDLGGFQWDAERAARLELLWRDMTAAGVKIVAYMPPYAPSAWAVARRVPAYFATETPTEAFLRRVAAELGIQFTNVSNPATIPCDEAEFLDVFHPKEVCLARLLRPRISGLASALPGHRGFQVSAVGRHPSLDDVETAQNELDGRDAVPQRRRGVEPGALRAHVVEHEMAARLQHTMKVLDRGDRAREMLQDLEAEEGVVQAR